MQRIPVFFIVALIFVALYYLTPLRDYMQSQYAGGKATPSGEEQQEEEPFDKLGLELLVVSNRVANMEGRLRILKMAEDNPDWLTDEEYSQLATVIAITEDELQKAQDEYERVKGEYARETATKIIRESLTRKEQGKGDTPPAEGESIPFQYLD